MKRRSAVIILGATALVLVGAVAAIAVAAVVGGGEDASQTADTAASTVQRSFGGGVEVTAFIATPEHLKSMDPAQAERVDLGSMAAIVLKIDTHQGDLGSFDFAGSARLAAGGGQEEAPLGWVVMKGDAHHIEGMLLFARQPRETTRLTLRGLGGVEERAFSFPGQR